MAHTDTYAHTFDSILDGIVYRLFPDRSAAYRAIDRTFEAGRLNAKQARRLEGEAASLPEDRIGSED